MSWVSNNRSLLTSEFWLSQSSVVKDGEDICRFVPNLKTWHA